jgi:Zn-dependent protease with chaperone function
MSQSHQCSKTWTEDDVRRFLPRPIEPVRVSPFYRAGLLAVAVSLIVLQSIYLSMIAAAAFATYYYIIHIPAIAGSIKVNILTVILLVTPPIAGGIVTFFLLKPLLARPMPPPELLKLDSSTQPLIFSFVARLCAMLGAPVPQRIDVDLQVNASARLLRAWRSLLTGDLALTIGLPLVSGLTVRQFSGVLAHEFGHFTQRAGMRLYFLIASIRLWFARVAYERDSWDIRLEHARENGDWRIRAVLYVSSAAVFCSRGILRGLLIAANIVSAWFSRQMEFDADRHEASLVGAEIFRQTQTRLPTLSLAAARTWQSLDQSWSTRRLSDDVAYLVVQHEAALDNDLRRQIVEDDLAETTGRWASHPCSTDRIANVRGLPGVLSSIDSFPADLPADVLFLDYPKLCRTAALHHYRRTLGDEIDRATVVSAERFLDDTNAAARRAEAVRGVFGALKRPSRWFRIATESADSGQDAVRFSLDEDDSARYWTLLEETLNRHAGVEVLRAGGHIAPEAFDLRSAEPAAAAAEARESLTALRSEIEKLRKLYRGSSCLFQEETDLRRAYNALAAEQDNLLQLRLDWVAHSIVAANLHMLSAARAANAVEASSKWLTKSCDAILARLVAVPTPVLDTAGSDKPRTLAGQLLLGIERSELEPEQFTAHLLDRVDDLGEQILGELCFHRPASG